MRSQAHAPSSWFLQGSNSVRGINTSTVSLPRTLLKALLHTPSTLLCACVVLAAGALYANGSSTVTIRDSALLSNFVKDYDNLADGGACYLWNAAKLVLINTTIHNNSAQNVGGGIAVGSKK